MSWKLIPILALVLVRQVCQTAWTWGATGHAVGTAYTLFSPPLKSHGVSRFNLVELVLHGNTRLESLDSCEPKILIRGVETGIQTIACAGVPVTESADVAGHVHILAIVGILDQPKGDRNSHSGNALSGGRRKGRRHSTICTSYGGFAAGSGNRICRRGAPGVRHDVEAALKGREEGCIGPGKIVGWQRDTGVAVILLG